MREYNHRLTNLDINKVWKYDSFWETDAHDTGSEITGMHNTLDEGQCLKIHQKQWV